MQANEKKRPKEDKDIVHRLRPFARLQTAEDFEAFVADTLCMCTQVHFDTLRSPHITPMQGSRRYENESKNYSITAAWA